MISHLRHPTTHPLAQELALRAVAVVLALVAILGLLPAIAGAAG